MSDVRRADPQHGDERAGVGGDQLPWTWRSRWAERGTGYFAERKAGLSVDGRYEDTRCRLSTGKSLVNPLACVLSCFSCAQLFLTLWTVIHQAPLSLGFSRQGYWSGIPFPLPGDLPNPGLKPESLTSPALASGFFTPSTIWEACESTYFTILFVYWFRVGDQHLGFSCF